MAESNYKRKLSWKKYVLALVLTCLIFLIGVLVGNTLTIERTTYLEDVAYKQKLDYESLQLQSLYLDLKATNASCSTFNHILETSLNDVANAQARVDFYMMESKNKGKKSYTELKRDYILAQVRYWLLNEKIKENCEPEHVSVLYFYSNEDCLECGAQGTILTYLKEKLKDKLLIFSLDADFIDEPMVNLLKQTYNITKIPSLVIKENVHDRLVSKDELVEDLCSFYESKPSLCLE